MPRLSHGPLVALTLSVAFATGCGKKADPLPPEPRGPLQPQGVTVRQIGPDMVVTFTVPSPRGPKPAQQPIEAELVRIEFPPGLPAPADPDAFRRRGQVITSEVDDPLQSGVRLQMIDRAGDDDPGVLVGSTVRYGIRVRDGRGRPSPLVATADIVPTAPPPPPTSVSALAIDRGVRLRWESPAGIESPIFNLYRGPAGTPLGENPINPTPIADTEFLDTRVTIGEIYTYVVHTAASDSMPVQESLPSLPVEILAEDRFAPEAPGGLVGVQEGLAVRLFWNPNSEHDLAGYRVYRSRDDGDWTPAGPEPISDTLFLDRDVEVGDRIAYRVTAVDRVDPPNESEPSDEIVIVVAPEPVPLLEGDSR